MIKNPYNLNLINILENRNYYDKDLLNFVLNKIDNKELNEVEINIGRVNDISCLGNFSALIARNKSYKIEKINETIEQIELHENSKFNKPEYGLTICHKDFLIGEDCYNEIKKISIGKFDYKKHESFKEKENEIFILFFLYSSFVINFKILEEKQKENLQNILIKNKTLLSKLNTDKVNLFLENEKLRDFLDALTIENRIKISQDLTIDKIINTYFKKLYKYGKYGISNYLEMYSKDDVVKIFIEKIEEIKKDWLNSLIEKASGQKIITLEKLINSEVVFLSVDKKASLRAMKEVVFLYDYFKDKMNFTEKQTNIIIAALAIVANKGLYIELRKKISPVLNEKMSNYMNEGKIGKDKIRDIEIEILKNEISEEVIKKDYKSKLKI